MKWHRVQGNAEFYGIFEYEGEMDVGQTQEEGPVMILPAELNQGLMQEGLWPVLAV